MHQEVHSIQRLVAWLITVLAMVILVGGVIIAFYGLGAQTTFKLFGQEFASTSVGVSLVFIGAVTVVLTFRRVLAQVPTPRSPSSRSSEYLSRDDLINLLLNFDSDAFKTPFRLEESLIQFNKRINDVKQIIIDQVGMVHPDYKKPILRMLAVLKVLQSESEKISTTTLHSHYIAWSSTGISIDSLRYELVAKVNDLLKALGYSSRINNKRFITDAELAFGERIDGINNEVSKAQKTLSDNGLDPVIVTHYIDAVREEVRRR